MIAVSDSFKKAIKSDNREIHGYVDIEFDAKDKDYSIYSIPGVSTLSMMDGSDLLDQNKIMTNYATLENNYFLLDGSFKLANSNVFYKAGGFISDKIYQNMESKEFVVKANTDGEIETPGISIYFKDNLAIDFIITITDMEDEDTIFNITNNEDYSYYLVFDNPITVQYITINVLRVEYNDRRLRIPEISVTPSALYEGNELISFTINEEIDVELQSNPINTCTININNYPDYEGGNKFDPINPKGLTSYLTENTQIKPYIGVLTEDSGVEYVSMGIFYLSNWSSDVDGNVTLNGQDILGILKTKPMISESGLLVTPYLDQIIPILKRIYGIDFDVSGYDDPIGMEFLKEPNIFGWLSAISIINCFIGYGTHFFRKILKTTRDNSISLSLLNHENSVDSLARTMLLEDVKYTTKSQVNTVEITYSYPWLGSSTGTNEYTMNTQYTLVDADEYIWFKLDKCTLNGNFSYTTTGSGNATLIDYNHYMLYVRLQGAVGDTFTLKFYGQPYEPSTRTKQSTNNLPSGNKISIDLSNYIWMSNDINERIMKYYLEHDFKYSISIKSIGIPYLETGDTISVQTRYNDENDGYKDVIITKQTFNYDGGLSCDIEGVAN